MAASILLLTCYNNNTSGILMSPDFTRHGTSTEKKTWTRQNRIYKTGDTWNVYRYSQAERERTHSAVLSHCLPVRRPLFSGRDSCRVSRCAPGTRPVLRFNWLLKRAQKHTANNRSRQEQQETTDTAGLKILVAWKVEGSGQKKLKNGTWHLNCGN